METKRLQGLTQPRLTELLERMRQCRAVLIGDMCLDETIKNYIAL